MVRALRVLALVLLACSVAGSAEALQRIRSTQPQVDSLIAAGVERSSTFRRLVDEIGRTDLVVYIELTPALSKGIAGRLSFLAARGGVRYLLVSVSVRASRNERLRFIAHELQHALEVAADPTVRDVGTFRELYERIGIVSHNGSGFDSIAARETEAQVRLDLRETASRTLSPGPLLQ
jgi:hypothetical protein